MNKMEKLLKRSSKKIIGGVCGGLGAYTNLDPVLWRVGFVVGAVFTIGIPFVLIYAIMWLVVPDED